MIDQRVIVINPSFRGNNQLLLEIGQAVDAINNQYRAQFAGRTVLEVIDGEDETPAGVAPGPGYEITTSLDGWS